MVSMSADSTPFKPNIRNIEEWLALLAVQHTAENYFSANIAYFQEE